MLTLDVAISTYQPQGLERVEKMLRPLSPIPGVSYIVSWQKHENANIPKYLLQREDVKIIRLDLNGLSNNRNNTIDSSTADIILIADDDLVYKQDAFEKVRKFYEDNPDIDLATFKFEYPVEKIYPKESCKLSLPFPKNYYGSSVEISFRRECLKDLRYWPGMGLGTPEMASGEDEFFLISAIKRGYNCWFVNETIGLHPQFTTGDHTSDAILRSQGFIIALMYPGSSVVRLILKAYRTSRIHKWPVLKALHPLIQGYIKAWKEFHKIPLKYRW